MVATPVSIHGVYLYWIGASSPPPLSKTFLSYVQQVQSCEHAQVF